MNYLTRQELAAWLDRLAQEQTLIAPIDVAGNILYRAVKDTQDVVWDFTRSYLLSAELFWPLSGRAFAAGRPLLQLTVGNVLLAFDALAAANASAGGTQWAQVQRLEAEWEAQRTRWAIHVEAKAQRELASRLRQWQAYVEEVSEAHTAEDYAVNVRPRLVAERLLGVLPDGPEVAGVREQLAQADSRIGPFLQPGPIVMDTALRTCYPEQTFPFLYRRSRSDRQRR